MTDAQISPEVLARARKIKLLLMDCDGVLTDGRLYFAETGESMKVFHARDGQGIVDWHKAGFRSGIISGRNSKIVDLRPRTDGYRVCLAGKGKGFRFNELLAAAGFRRAKHVHERDTPDAAVMPCRPGCNMGGDAHGAVKGSSLRDPGRLRCPGIVFRDLLFRDNITEKRV